MSRLYGRSLPIPPASSALALCALFDAIITLATLVSAGIMLLWGVSLDGILGALISLVIIKAGIEMLASPVNELLGVSIPAELTSEIKKEVSAFEGVRGVYDLILHNYGPDVKIGSLHINVYDKMSAHEIHALTRKITNHMFDKHRMDGKIPNIYASSQPAIVEEEKKDKDKSIYRQLKRLIEESGFTINNKNTELYSNFEKKNFDQVRAMLIKTEEK